MEDSSGEQENAFDANEKIDTKKHTNSESNTSRKEGVLDSPKLNENIKLVCQCNSIYFSRVCIFLSI